MTVKGEPAAATLPSATVSEADPTPGAGMWLRSLPGFRVRVDLRSGDTVYWMEIPFNNAAGFRHGYERSRRLRAEPAEAVAVELDAALAETGLLRSGRLVWGSHDTSVYRFLPRRPYYATMLRDPVGRVLTAFLHYRGRPGAPDNLLDFLEWPEVADRLHNRQVRQLAGCVEGGERGLSAESMLTLARLRLLEFTFVGLTDRWRESHELFRHTFGLARRRRGAARRETAPTGLLTPDAGKRIVALNRLDLRLLREARYELEAARREMRRERRDHRPVKRLRAVWAVRIRFAGQVRRHLIPEGSWLEAGYLSLRKRVLGW